MDLPLELTSPTPDLTTKHFDETVMSLILGLDEATQSRIFQMLTDYIDVLPLLLPTGNHPILAHIKGESWADILKEITDAQGDVSTVNHDNPKPLIDAYDAWKSKQPK